MKYLLRWLTAAVLLIVSVVLVQAQKVSVEYNHQESFSRFRTYSWILAESYQRPILALNIQGAIDGQLADKGLKYVEHDGDLVVNAYGAIDSDLSVSYRPDIYIVPGLYGVPWWTPGAFIPGTSTAIYVKKGTLVIDIADPHSKELKWRGLANVTLDPSQQKKSFEKINKAVEKMFRDYPVR